MMRLLLLLAGWTACALGQGSARAAGAATSAEPRAKGSETVLSWHFVGTSSLTGTTDGSQAREILRQPASQHVVSNTVTKLSRAPAAWLGLNNATNPATADLLRPWIQAILENESQGELIRGTDSELAVLVAVRAPAERSDLLRARWAAWTDAVGGTAPADVKVGQATVRGTKLGAAGWSRAGKVGDWTLLGMGKGSDQAFADFAGRGQTRPGGESWLTLKASGPALARITGMSTATAWPDMEFQTSGRGPILRTTARLSYSQPLDLKLEPWRIPTHTIGDPVVSFSVVQGVRSWLSQQAWWKQLGFPVTPNQATAWSMAEIPFASFVSWEMPQVTNTLSQLGPRVPGFLATYFSRIPFGEVVFQTNTTRVAWIGLPIAEPFVSPAATEDPGTAVAGLFPLVKARRPVPAELLSQITSRTNLVYYDWELTAQRVNGWRHVKNLYWMLAGYLPPPTNHTGESWLTETNITERLGNTATEVVLSSPRELSGLRNSALGLTGLELVALMRWLDDPAFPALSDPPITPSAQRRNRPPEGGTAPAAPKAPPAKPATRAATPGRTPAP